MSERLNKTSICTVIFVGIVDYAQMPVDDQIALKERFNALINEAVAQISQNDRIILDTGEGAAIALLGAPEDALAVALSIRDGVLRDREQHPERTVSVRIGINLGPVRVVNDLNDRLNVVGDGINAAQRVMSFAPADRILVSRSYYEIASRLSTELAGMFRLVGTKTDKFAREHEVYGVLEGEGDEVFDALSEGAADPAQTLPEKLKALRAYAIPALGVLIAMMLAWGYWISRPAENAVTPEVATKQNEFQQAADESSDTQNDTPKQTKKTRAKHKQSEPSRTAHAEPEKSSGEASAPPPSDAATASSEPERNPLCSDAQRMLKQC